jgi:GNAT superfamily N-acetyltransferase
MMGAIRAARADDYDAFVVLRRELGVDDPVPSEERFANHLVPRMLVYERRRQVQGYVLYAKLTASGHIASLVVSPGERGGGVGTALMMAAAQQLRARGLTGDWHLNVKADNAPAIRLYERLGFQVLHHSVMLRFAWEDLSRLPADPATMMVRPVADAVIADIERALGIIGGRLELSRSRGIGVTLQLRDEQLAAVGVACFDPAFPGAYPFCVARPSLAGALLRALEPYARPGDRELQIGIEHDDALADTLIAAGAVVRHRLLHYAGPLPLDPDAEPEPPGAAQDTTPGAMPTPG